VSELSGFSGCHENSIYPLKTPWVESLKEATMPLSFDTLACPSGGLKDVNGLTGGEKNRSERFGNTHFLTLGKNSSHL